MATEHMRLTIHTDREVSDIIMAKQGDANSRFLDITLAQNNGRPHDLTDTTVRFNAQKRDGTTIFNNCKIIDAAAGLIEVELTDQTLAIGKSIVFADISIHQGEIRILTTRTISIHVQAMLRDDNAIESSNEFGAVIALFQDVYDMRVLITDMSDRIGAPEDDMHGDDTRASETLFGGLNRIWNAAGAAGASNRAVFTENGVFSVPSGVTKIWVDIIGAGGDGGRGYRSGGTPGAGNLGASGGDGGSGYFYINKMLTVTDSDVFNIIVGAGNSVVGTLISAPKGGNGGNAAAAGGKGGDGGNGGNGGICAKVANSFSGSGGDGGVGYNGNGGNGGWGGNVSLYKGGNGGYGEINGGNGGYAYMNATGGNGGNGRTGSGGWGGSSAGGVPGRGGTGSSGIYSNSTGFMGGAGGPMGGALGGIYDMYMLLFPLVFGSYGAGGKGGAGTETEPAIEGEYGNNGLVIIRW